MGKLTPARKIQKAHYRLFGGKRDAAVKDCLPKLAEHFGCEANRPSVLSAMHGKHLTPVNQPAKKVKKKDFYSGWEWKQARFEAINLCGRRCMCCGWQPGDTEAGYLVVDHVKPRSKFPELALEVSNLQVLCNDCNMGKSNVYYVDFRHQWDHMQSHFADIREV